MNEPRPYLRPVAGLLLVCLLPLGACPGEEPAPGRTVVVYVSEDPVFSEPVLRAFEADMGIRVKAEYHPEETKSTGVMNRFLAEKDSPQADVYRAGEPVRTGAVEAMKRCLGDKPLDETHL